VQAVSENAFRFTCNGPFDLLLLLSNSFPVKGKPGAVVFPRSGAPGQGRWEIYGLGVPDGILEKVYHLNAERLFAQFKGIPPGGDATR